MTELIKLITLIKTTDDDVPYVQEIPNSSQPQWEQQIELCNVNLETPTLENIYNITKSKHHIEIKSTW